MRTLPAALSLLGTLLAAGTPVVVKAPLTRVRLHPDEAWMTRVARTQLSGSGTHTFRIENLPSGLTLDDVRLSAKGPEGARLGDISLGSEPREVQETAEWKALAKEREGLQGQHDALEAEEEAIQTELEFLKSLRASYREEVSSRVSTLSFNATSLLELSKGLQARTTDLLTRKRRVTAEKAKLFVERQRLDQEMEKKGSEVQASPSHVVVEFTTPRPGPLELELTTRTRSARWSPAYEARLSADRQQLELVLYAAVAQQSGEDWNQVALEISNVRSSRSLSLPRYEGAQDVGYTRELERPSPHRAAIVGATVSQNMYVPSEAKPAPVPLAEQPAAAMEEARGLATAWVLTGTKTVPADGEPHRFMVLAKALAPETALVAVPRLDPTVYLVARFAPPEGVPLFPSAPVVQFSGSQRLGQATLRLPEAGRPFELSFGPYRGARVSLSRLEARKEEVGFGTKDRQWTVRERIEVSHNEAAPLAIDIQDRILRSTQEVIKISELPKATPGVEKTPGVRTWSLVVAPKTTATIDLGFILRAPLEGHVTGLRDLKLPD